jgi:filamentous hemagglutinin
VVNISTPNGAGISHNQFKDYNVGKEGPILNNATGKLNQTQLGGLINGNANLKAGKEARGIINEVTGGNRSQLNGYTEVVGKAANVMVANPYGITCNGCGFINTPQATLTTGKPVFDANGNLQALDVKKGSITIEGQGIDASNSDALSIISRAAEVNAAIHAKDLKVIAGANRVNADGSVQAQQGEGPAPVVAVDTGALGGMYANRIHLVSSEKGVGVNLGDLNARQGDITLDANGKLTVHNSLASGAITAKGQSIAVTGDHKASGNITLGSQGDIALSDGSLNSDSDLQLTADGNITHSREKLTAGRDATLAAKNISQEAASQINAARDISTKARDTLNNQGQMTAGQNLTASAITLTQDGKLLAKGNTQLNASTLNNSGDVQGNNLTITSNALNNSGSLLSGNTLNINTQDFTQRGSTGAKGKTAITASNTFTNTGSLISDDTLTLKGGSVLQNGVLSGGKGLLLTVNSLTSGSTSVTHSGDSLYVQAAIAALEGELSAGGDLTLSGDQLTTADNAQLLGGNNLSISARKATLAGTQAAEQRLTVNASESLEHHGKSSAETVILAAPELSNSGSVVASTLTTRSQMLTNSGLLQGDVQLALNTDKLNNLQDGTLYSTGMLSLDIPDITNHGMIASDAAIVLHGQRFSNSGQLLGSALSLDVNTLNNSGVLQSDSLLTLNSDTFSNALNGTLYSAGEMTLYGADIHNQGSIVSDAALALQGQRTDNSGKVIGNSLSLNSDTLTSDGLLQGNNALTLSGDTLSQGAAGRWLTAGNLDIKAKQLTTAGTTQGLHLDVNATDWHNSGSALATGGLNTTLTNSLFNDGELMSQGDFTLIAPTQTNNGSFLAAGALSLTGQQFGNSGTLQGNQLTLTQDSINNQGAIIGLNGLTLNSTRALNNSGDLLSQQALTANAGNITNSGRVQGQNITLEGSSLNNSGAIQSALDLALTLSGDMQAVTGSKITALGDAHIAGKALTNQGLVSAKTLDIRGDSLSNSGEISGVNSLNVSLNGDLQQQGKMLTGGQLTVNAQDISNSGQLQGSDTQINASTLTNSGRIQGDTGLTLTLLNTLTNQSNGIILSQNGLSVTAPVLTNDGTIQGNGTTTLRATTQTRNNGKLLSGGDLSLTTPDYSGSGWLQATNLVLNVAKLANSGTTITANQARLTGNTLNNTGTFQAAMLHMNYQSLTNSGTLLGNQSLTLKGGSLNNNNGKVFSGGDLLAELTSLSGTGQLVALGNLTLKLVNTWSAQGVVASNKQLAISSQGDISNNGTLQGNGITLNATGTLSNNGLMTAGSGTTSLSGSQIAMNAAGSLQAGGDVNLTSRGNITLDGFTGTAGNLTLSAPGSIINTALLYAGNNLLLFASSIQNIYGDMLAGNNLWLQKDAGGAANTEVINISGNIETTNGDITINTANLLNTRDGLKVDTTYQEFMPSDQSQLNVSFASMGADNLGVASDTLCSGGENTHCTTYHWLVPIFTSDEKTVLVNQKETTVTANGGAARIASGGNLTVNVGTLTNESSYLLANGDITLHGNILNNASAESGKWSTWQQYSWSCAPRCTTDYDPFPTSQTVEGWLKAEKKDKDSGIAYDLSDTWTDYTSDNQQYRAVIQAGGNVSANFASDISNTNSTANAGKISNTIVTPSLNTPSAQSVDGGANAQSLDDAGTLTITTPDWKDTSGDAGKNIDGGTGLTPGGIDGNYPLPSGKNGYFVTSTDPDSPYLITVNPKLDGLGQLDPSLFGDLYKLLGMNPGAAPKETNSQYTDVNQFLGSPYMLDKLNLDPDNDYRFLGDAAFDTRYVSNYVLNQTGTRYINGLGSDLDQMRYLMDSAADAQTSLGLTFGVALTADQIAALDHSILWYETATINGQTVMVPKVYLSPKDVTVQNGSVISGNNVQLAGSNITNDGGSLLAQNGLSIDSSNNIDNLNAGLISAGGGLDLSAFGDINNIDSSMSGKTVQLESTGGNINNITRTEQWNAGSDSGRGNIHLSGTDVGQTASITATDGLYMGAANDINITGANVKAGGDVAMGAGNNINIAANQINDSSSQSGAWGKKDTSATSTSNAGSSIAAGGNAIMQAGNDLNVTASAVDAGKTAQLVAGNDLNLNAADNSQTSRTGGSETHHSSADSTTITAGDNVTLVAGRDVTSQAAGIAAEGNVGIQAGRDVNLAAEATTTGSSSHSSKKTVIDESVRQQGTEIASGGNTTIIAGRDVNSEAAQVTTQGDIGIAAGRDVNLSTATESDYHYKEEKKTKSGFLSKKTTHTIEEDSATREAGTLLSGDNVKVIAGNNILVKGSAVVGDGDVALSAGNNVDIIAATNTDSSWRFKEEKESGLMGSGGIGFTIGSRESKQDLREEGTTQSDSFSTIGSTGGSVAISAGNQAHIGGADLIAHKDLSLSGDSVLIDPGHDKRSHDETFEQKSSGLTIALSGAAGTLVNNAVSSAQDAKQSSDSRLAALNGTKAALSGVQAGQAVALDAAKGAGTADDPNNNTIGISASLGAESAKSESHLKQDTTTGSTLSAGNNLSITATGSDITIAGSQIKAGGNAILDAARDVNLIASQDTQEMKGSNKSSGGAIGIGIGVGSGGAGITISASGHSSKGNEKGNGTWNNETTIDAGNQLSIISGRDTTLSGAQVSGDKVIADIGRDLTIESLQDSDHYDSKQTSMSGGLSYTFGAGTASGSFSYSRDKMNSDYDSVQEQSGIFAGKGGFDVTVGNHTQLDGGVIASTASADKNSLDTGTLGFSDVHNQADFSTSHQGGGISTGGNPIGQLATNAADALLSGGGSDGHAEGTTRAAVSDGTITIRDKDNQKQDVADLSREAENANGSIGPIFDKEKEQKRLQEVQLVGEIGAQATDIARTQGDLIGREAAKDPKALDEARQQLMKEGKPATDDDVAKRAYNNASSFYGTGGPVQMGIQAATAALSNMANGGDLAGTLAGASAPALANIIGHHAGINDNDTAKAIAHALLGGAVASLQGNSAAAGAAGALSGELAAHAIIDALYPGKDASDLSESDKQLVSNLVTIAAGLAGNMAGGDSRSTIAGAQAGKNAAENNALSKKDKIFDINPMLKIGIEDTDGDLLKGGGGIAKGIVPLGRGSTGRTTPNSLGEKLSMEQAMSNPVAGRQLPLPMTDPRWPKSEGWVKMAQNVNGVEVHYVRNTKTGQVDDFKFK